MPAKAVCADQDRDFDVLLKNMQGHPVILDLIEEIIRESLKLKRRAKSVHDACVKQWNAVDGDHAAFLSFLQFKSAQVKTLVTKRVADGIKLPAPHDRESAILYRQIARQYIFSQFSVCPDPSALAKVERNALIRKCDEVFWEKISPSRFDTVTHVRKWRGDTHKSINWNIRMISRRLNVTPLMAALED